MTDLPKISVIMPSYNQGKFLEQAILSVLGQEYPNLELLVLDGGSTDNSAEIIKKYESRLAYWRSEKDNGQAAAINEGMRRATGDILCWLNSDDMFFPGALHTVGSVFRTDYEKPRLLYGGSLLYHEEQQDSGSIDNAEEFDADKLTVCDFIIQPSSFWTRAVWQKAGELNPDLCYTLDWDWYLRASKVTLFEYSGKCFSIYRYQEDNKTQTGGTKRHEEIVALVEKYADDYWSDLYRLVKDNLYKIWNTVEMLDKNKLPRRLLVQLTPCLWGKLKNKEDIWTVLRMLRR